MINPDNESARDLSRGCCVSPTPTSICRLCRLLSPISTSISPALMLSSASPQARPLWARRRERHLIRSLAQLKISAPISSKCRDSLPVTAKLQSPRRRKLADSVVAYLVADHQIPVYRIHTLAEGNAKVTPSSQGQQTDSSGKPVKPYHGARVEVTVLKDTGEEELNNQAMASPTRH